MASRTKSRTPSANTEKTIKNTRPVCCMDCLHSKLMRYDNNPVLAECHRKPQPGNERFPYQREVARPLRQCAMHKHTDEPKEIEQRSGHPWETKAA